MFRTTRSARSLYSAASSKSLRSRLAPNPLPRYSDSHHLAQSGTSSSAHRRVRKGFCNVVSIAMEDQLDQIMESLALPLSYTQKIRIRVLAFGDPFSLYVGCPSEPASFIGAGFAGLIAFIRYNDEKRAVPKGQGDHNQADAFKGPVIGGPFSLVNTEGQTFTEQDLLGNWVLLYFGYTSSPDVGPEQLQTMAKTINILESKQKIKILPVFVTIDPQRDNPAHLGAYLKEFDPRIVGLTGPVSAIRQMAQEYRVFFKRVEEDGDDYLVESSHNMYLLNPSSKVVRLLGMEYNADELAEAITNEVKKATDR